MFRSSLVASSLISRLTSNAALRASSFSTSMLRKNEENSQKVSEDVDTLFGFGSNSPNDNELKDIPNEEAFKSKKHNQIAINRVELLGNVAAEPAIHTAKNGTEYAIFNVFTNIHGTRRDGTDYERTEVHSVSCFNMLPYIKARVHKGSKVFVNGELHYIQPLDRNQNRSAWVKANLIQTIDTSKYSRD